MIKLNTIIGLINQYEIYRANMLDFQIELERQNNLLMFLNSVKDNSRAEILRAFINAEKDVLLVLKTLPEKENKWLLDVFYSYQELQRKVLTKILEESFPDLPAKYAVLQTFIPHAHTNNPQLDLVIEKERQDNLSRFLMSVDSAQNSGLLELIYTQKQLLERLKMLSPGSRDYRLSLEAFLTNYYVQKHMLSFVIETCYPDFPGKRNVLNCLLPQKNTPPVNRQYSLTYPPAQNDDTTFFRSQGQKRRKLDVEFKKTDTRLQEEKSLGQ